MPDTFSDCCGATLSFQTTYSGLPKNYVVTKAQLAPFVDYDGIRFWHGILTNGDHVLVLVGTMKDVNGNYVDTNTSTNFTIAKRPCPSWCTGADASLSH